MEISNKRSHKAIMKRSRLRNKCLRDWADISREEYKNHRYLCVSLLKKAKKYHFANLDIKSVTDNKKFWQTVKLLFSTKAKAKAVIKLVENDEIIDDESEKAKKFNGYFVNIVKKTRNINRRTNYVFCSKLIKQNVSGYN